MFDRLIALIDESNYNKIKQQKNILSILNFMRQSITRMR